MFGKSASSIKVIDAEKGGKFRLIKNKHSEFVCDFCGGHPLCSKYCFTKAITVSYLETGEYIEEKDRWICRKDS